MATQVTITQTTNPFVFSFTHTPVPEEKPIMPRRRNKHGAIRTEIDGIKFASLLEARRYDQLKIMLQAGVISDLVVHPRFLLIPSFDQNGLHFTNMKYTADFQYFDKVKDKTIIEEIKGFRTVDFIMREKMFRYMYVANQPDVIYQVLSSEDF